MAALKEAADAGVAADVVERVIAAGDLAELSPADRVRYYQEVCTSLGLNPLTRPFEYLKLSGKLQLYARKDATDQMRSLRHVSVEIVGRETIGDLYVVTARATTPDGRRDEEIGAVAIKGLSGEALANGLMKASTKAKRRVTLCICGLGVLDESEVSSIPDARVVRVDAATGEVIEETPAPAGRGIAIMPAAEPAGAALNAPSSGKKQPVTVADFQGCFARAARGRGWSEDQIVSALEAALNPFWSAEESINDIKGLGVALTRGELLPPAVGEPVAVEERAG